MSYLVFFAVPTVLIILLTPMLLAEPRVRRRFAARNKAEKKAFGLLQSWLTPQQEKQWAAGCGFDVIGCHTGTRYRISYASAMNVYQFDAAGRTVAQWCFAPEGGLCIGDVLLAQKIALETMERQVLAIANSRDSMR